MFVKTNVTYMDYVRAQLYLAPRMKFNWVIAFIIWAYIFFNFLNKLGEQVGFPGDAICNFCTITSSLIVSTGYTIIILLILFLGGVILGLILLMSDRTPGILGEHEFTLKDDGLLETTSVNETLSKWVSISSVTKTKRYIYIRLGLSFHLIPKNSFQNQAQFDEFWEDLNSKWQTSQY
jgi:hypothetical protein